MMSKQINKLTKLLEQIETYFPAYATVNAGVSKASAGWHLSHSLITLAKVVENIAQSDPAAYKRSFSFARYYILAVKNIPRGKGRAPRSVLPLEITEPILLAQLKQAMMQVEILKALKPDQYFEHPNFGHLKLHQTTLFMEIHTRHHLKIVRDILAV